ncbi:TPA: dihydrofolate reductase family protein [Photobacterium damselae]
MPNIVYIATSLDGYIADKNNQLDWLHDVPNPDCSDFGFAEFMDRVDALIMGRNTVDMVLSFDCEWPYSKPVYVLSNTMKTVPAGYEDKIYLVNGELPTIVEELQQKGLTTLYIDGGKTIQSFLQQDMIDELIITTIPTILGGGIPLFGELDKPLKFKHIKAEQLAGCLVKNTYLRSK